MACAPRRIPRYTRIHIISLNMYICIYIYMYASIYVRARASVCVYSVLAIEKVPYGTSGTAPGRCDPRIPINRYEIAGCIVHGVTQLPPVFYRIEWMRENPVVLYVVCAFLCLFTILLLLLLCVRTPRKPDQVYCIYLDAVAGVVGGTQ